MARTSRVVLNRAVFEQLWVAQADALFEVAEKVIDVAQVPDASPLGQGLIEGGGALAYVGNKKVAGTTIGGRQIKKPRSLRTSAKTTDQVAIAGFGFPGRFVELGTIDTRANPFLTRAVAQVAPGAEVIISESIRKRLAGIRSFSGFKK